MVSLRIEPADDTPFINFDKTNGIFEISGKSLPEDAVGFFNPVLEWLKEYAINPNDNTEFIFKLIYFNTASSKLFLDIMMILEEINETGKKVTVHWHFYEDDEDMQEAGVEFEEMVDLEFRYILVSS